MFSNKVSKPFIIADTTVNTLTHQGGILSYLCRLEGGFCPRGFIPGGFVRGIMSRGILSISRVPHFHLRSLELHQLIMVRVASVHIISDGLISIQDATAFRTDIRL